MHLTVYYTTPWFSIKIQRPLIKSIFTSMNINMYNHLITHNSIKDNTKLLKLELCHYYEIKYIQ